MAESPRTDLAPLFLRLSVLWVAAGALFKLFAGTPADLPPTVRAFPLGLDLTFKLAIAIELSITFAALLRPKLAWPFVVALFAIFEVVLLLVLLEGAASCGCFGSSIAIPPAVMMAIDGLLLVAILAARPWRSTARPLAPVSVLVLTTLLSFAAPFLIIGDQSVKPAPKPENGENATDEEGATDVSGHRYVELPIMSWEGQMIYDTELATLLGDELNTVPIDATAVVYRATCDHCALHMEELALADDGSRAFLFLRLPDDGANEENTVVRTLPRGGHVTQIDLPEGPQYLLETPADFQLEGAIIRSPREGLEVDEH